MHHHRTFLGAPSSLMLLLALLAATALGFGFVLSSPVTGQDANDDVDADAAAAEQSDGFATPEEASRAFFEGVRARDERRVRRVVPPAERDTFDRQGARLMMALTINELDLGKTRRDDERASRAYTYYEWDVEIDEGEMVAAALDDLLESLREDEMDAEEIERYLEEHGPTLRQFVRGHVDQLRRPKQRMTLGRIDGRWYVEDIADPSYRPDNNEEADE